jgi:hypothetical protein
MSDKPTPPSQTKITAVPPPLDGQAGAPIPPAPARPIDVVPTPTPTPPPPKK